MEEICKKELCTGCFACVNACPKKCISMQENEIGHIYPKINNEVCIDCGICKSVCSVNTEPEKVLPKKVFASYSLDEKEHESSTSGGMAAGFSRAVLSNGGVVYGCSSKVEGAVSHIRVDSLKDASLLQGSKYVHSYINDCFTIAKKDLVDGKKVLFTGTPCQIAGLKSFLKKDYDNLVCVDLICHGVPPQKLLFENLDEFDCNGNIISFREPEGYVLSLKNGSNGEILYRETFYKDLYFLGFNKGMYFRDACYSCTYAENKRCSDITIGDFWGLGKNVPFSGSQKNGISVVLINTDKGEDFWNEVKESFFYEERELEEAMLKNPNLRRPSIPHKNRKSFSEMYTEMGLKKTIKKLMADDIKKYKLLSVINKSKILTKLLGTVAD